MNRPDLDPALLEDLARQHGTPLYVYDLRVVERSLAAFSAFDAVRYAVKANPNLSILATLRAGGAVCDAVSAGEVERALAAGFAPSDVVYTADLLDRAGREVVARHALYVNCGSASMLDDVAEIGASRDVTLRVNPGFGDGHDEKVTTGGPLSKHGIWHEDLAATRERARALGLRVTGLHVHIGSGTDTTFLRDTIGAMGDAVSLFEDDLERVSCGGGMSFPYREDDREFDLATFSSAWREARDAWSERVGRHLALEAEPGRMLVAGAGLLLTEVCGTKSTGDAARGGRRFVRLDAGFHTQQRP
ncbi:MAG: diaminopimelate decarboxylase, partial [Planctomycetota bacterium]